jgi:hypothetical protein
MVSAAVQLFLFGLRKSIGVHRFQFVETPFSYELVQAHLIREVLEDESPLRKFGVVIRLNCEAVRLLSFAPFDVAGISLADVSRNA